jgi:hypothetical protein
MLRSAALAFGLALVAAGSASAELVARGVQDGALALGPKGTPYVAYVHGQSFVIASRGSGRWRAQTADSVASGSQLMAFEAGAAGPVALVQSADNRRLDLVRRVKIGWRSIPMVRRLPARMLLGWPGLALDGRGGALVAYVRWNAANFKTQLVLVRVDAGGHLRTQRITALGFPQSYVPPPAEPVIVGKRVHVLEASGWRGTVVAFEWFPHSKTWTGLGVDVSRGDWPLGPIFAGERSRTVYAAWTNSMLGYGFVPVTLAEHGARGLTVHSEFVLDRALTTALALPASGPEIAANEWVADEDLGLDGQDQVWAGVIRNSQRVELDGWIAGLAAEHSGARDLLLAGPAGLSWFRSPGKLTTLVTIDATTLADGVHLSGRVDGVASGRVSLYRELPGAPRRQLASVPVSGGSYSFVDGSAEAPLLYRAVYTDPATGIPFAALLRPQDP